MKGEKTQQEDTLMGIKEILNRLIILVDSAIESKKNESNLSTDDTIFSFSSGTQEDNGKIQVGYAEKSFRATRPALPDPRLLRRILHQRQLRARYFDSDLFGDPAWDMLLDLAAARAEYRRVSVTSLCIASGVPPTTALRWISEMTKMGLLQRSEDEADRRRAFVSLTDKASDTLSRYFAEIGSSAAGMV